MSNETDTKQTLKGTAHMASLERFLIDIDCLSDLYAQVVPILEHADKERQKKANALFLKYAKPDPSDSKALIVELPTEENQIFIETLNKMNRASILFKRNILVSVVACYEEYISDQLRLTFCLRPERFASSDKSIPYREIASWGNGVKPIDIIIGREVDDIMRLSAEEQLRHIDKEFKVGLFDKFSDILLCIEACDRRNLYAHTGGVVTKLYLDRVRSYGYKWKDGKEPEVGVKIEISKDYFDQTISVFTLLSVRLTQGLLRRFFPDEKGPADRHIQDVGFAKLKNEHYVLAEKIFDFALEIPEKFIASDEIRKIFLINKCIALYYQKRKEEMEKELKAIDWSAMHPKFNLALQVLRERWTEAVKMMGEANLTEKDFRDWPLFREFRRTKDFQEKYRELFGKDISYESRTEDKTN